MPARKKEHRMVRTSDFVTAYEIQKDMNIRPSNCLLQRRMKITHAKAEMILKYLI